MPVQFFGHEVENPILKTVITIGAAVFAAALLAVIAVILIPVLGAVLTGVLLVVAVILVLLIIFVPLISFLGVIFSSGRRGSGRERTEERSLESFHSVKVSGKVSAVVVIGDEPSITVSTDDNLLEFVRTEVRKGVLHVGFSRGGISLCPPSAVHLRR